MLKGKGYTCVTDHLLTSNYGDAVARHREVVLGFRADEEELSSVGWGPILPPGRLKKHLVREPEPAGLWLRPEEFEYRSNPSLSTTGDPQLPCPVGHVRRKRDGARFLVYSVEGPAVTPKVPESDFRGPGNMVIQQLGPRGELVRVLRPEEVWRLQGGARGDWQEDKRETLLKEAARACPPKGAAEILRWALSKVRGKRQGVSVARRTPRRRPRGGR